jgi:hypothetical protein
VNKHHFFILAMAALVAIMAAAAVSDYTAGAMGDTQPGGRPGATPLATAVPPAPAGASIPTQGDAPPAGRAGIKQALMQLPLRFIANAGQTDPEVRFTVKAAGQTIFFTPDEVVFSAVAGSAPQTRRPPDAATAQSQTVRLRFAGANTRPDIAGLEPLPGAANFFLGNDPAKWQANVPTYGAVAYRNLYPGVDLVYRGVEGRLKSEFRLAPGADPAAIRMEYQGVEAIRLDADGALVLHTPLGELVEAAPLIYQEAGGARQAVAGGYVLLQARPPSAGPGRERVGFRLAAYDPARPLVIDPVLAFSTYLGGSSTEGGNGIAVDGAGNAYVTGNTSSSDFPTRNPLQANNGGVTDAFVTQVISASGVYTYGYSTYLGGSGDDFGVGIAVDGAGNAYVTGYTYSSDFPTHNAIQASYGGGGDAFVTQVISASGVYTYGYSTYLGGSGNEGGNGIAVDGAGNAYVTGNTSSSNFPTRNPLQASNGGGDTDAFVTQVISASGVYTYGYSTYLGGSDYDLGAGIAVDGAGNAYVTGSTSSSNFPTRNPLQASNGGGSDAFIAKITLVPPMYLPTIVKNK